MVLLISAMAVAYLTGYLILWRRVEADSFDPHNLRRQISNRFVMPMRALTTRGKQRWRVARAYTVLGALSWCGILAMWIGSELS